MKSSGLRIRSILANEHLQNMNSKRYPIIELCGDKRILIELHKGIDEYTPNSIRIWVKYGSVHIEGEGLRVCKMSVDQLLICGRIDHVHLIRGRAQ